MGRPMKDSGVEWIGEIPDDWVTSKLLYFLRKPITDGPHETPNYVDRGVPFLSVNAIDWQGNINRNVNTYITEEDAQKFNEKTNLEVGDILFTKAATIGKMAIVDKVDFMIWSPIAVIKGKPTIDNRYMKFIFQCEGYLEYVSNLGTKNTQVNVGMRAMEKAKIPIPVSLEEQRKIVEFLEPKVLRIDSIIEKTQASIAVFKRYKQALITETVTKGLNPDVSMKDSGIEWIGMIPEHWEVSKLGRIFEVILGKMLATEPKEPDWTLEKYIRAANVHFEGVDLEEINTMWFSPQEKERLEVRYEDLLIVEGGAGAGGSALFLSEKGNYYIQNSINLVRPKTVQGNTRYTYYLLYSLVKNGYIDFVCNKATFAHFTKEKVSAVPHPIIPIVEQHQIAAFLDEKTAHIDRLIQNKESMIEKLEAYKKSLVYEYVTGKKEV